MVEPQESSSSSRAVDAQREFAQKVMKETINLPDEMIAVAESRIPTFR